MSKESTCESSGGAISTVTVNAVDTKLRTALFKGTFGTGPPLANGGILSLEKPDSFCIDYDLNKMDVRFQFMNSARAFDRDLQLKYTHTMKDNRVLLNGTLGINPTNKFSVNYGCHSGNYLFKYSYTKGATTLEPSYNVQENAWDFMVSQRKPGGDVVRASYGTNSKVLTLEWDQGWKFTASVNLGEENKAPQLSFEKTWTFMEF